MKTRQQLADEHGEIFANEFDEAFDIETTHETFREKLHKALNTTIVFYVVGVADGILVALAIAYYLGIIK